MEEAFLSQDVSKGFGWVWVTPAGLNGRFAHRCALHSGILQCFSFGKKMMVEINLLKHILLKDR